MHLDLSLRTIKRAHAQEKSMRRAFAACAMLSILITIGIAGVLAGETYGFFQAVSWREFFGSGVWAPMFEPRHFGIWPLVCGTFIITVGSALIGVPLGLLTALFLTEFAPQWLRQIVKPVLEILAGIPTVVFGFFAVSTITPVLQKLFPTVDVFNAASAAIVVGIMVLPTVATLCDDALRAVPRSLKEAGYALGATKFEVATQVSVPAALAGIGAAFMLAVSRAFGETMAVTLAAGSTPKLTLNPAESVQTLTAYIVQVSTGDVPQGSIEYESIFAVGALLFLVTLCFNLLAYRMVKKWRSVTE